MYCSPYVDVQTSGSQEVRWTTKDDWKSDTMELGEQSVMIYLATVKLLLSAVVLDSGLYSFGSLGSFRWVP